jgi:Ca-activated chloride channel family protein
MGGLVSRDFTQGYGPEEYCLHKAQPGTYKIAANYYGSQAAQLMGPVTVQAEIITHFGRPNEKRKSLTLRLEDKKETVLIGEVEF